MVIEILHSAPTPRWTPHTALADGMGDSNVFHVEFDPDVDSTVEVIVRAVTSIKNADPLSLDPLGDSIDPALLEGLTGHGSTEIIRQAEITFFYEGLNITVEDDGNVWLEWDESDEAIE